MKKIAIAVLILAVISLAGYAGQNPTVLKVKVQTANIRAQADTAGAVIKQVGLGTLLESRAKVGDWYEVAITTDAGGQVVGFISATVVDVLSGGQIQAPVREEAPVRQPARNVPREEAPVAESGPVPSTGGFKLIGGFGSASMSFTSSSTTDTSQIDQYKKGRMGFAGGIGFEMGGTIGIEIDFLYIQKGVRFQGSASDAYYGNVTFEATSKFDEVCVPVLLKFHVLNRAKGPDIYLAAGGEVGYMLGPKVDYTASGSDISPVSGTITSDDLKDSLNKLDYGLIFGGGASMPFGGIKFFVEARYHLGLANLEKVPAGGTESGTKPKTSVFLIMAGIKL